MNLLTGVKYVPRSEVGPKFVQHGGASATRIGNTYLYDQKIFLFYLLDYTLQALKFRFKVLNTADRLLYRKIQRSEKGSMGIGNVLPYDRS
jgi:hypothetical protein